jgi:hypothetical protein
MNTSPNLSPAALRALKKIAAYGGPCGPGNGVWFATAIKLRDAGLVTTVGAMVERRQRRTRSFGSGYKTVTYYDWAASITPAGLARAEEGDDQ